MRRIRSALFLILLIFVNAVCLTFSVASVSADDVVLIPVQNESDGILIPADGQEWYRVNRFEDNQSYILSVRNPADDACCRR